MSNIFEICCFCLPVQLVKLCISMIDAGKAYNAANKQFVSGIRELAQQSTTDEVIEVKRKRDVAKNILLESFKKNNCSCTPTLCTFVGTVQDIFLYPDGVSTQTLDLTHRTHSHLTSSVFPSVFIFLQRILHGQASTSCLPLCSWLIGWPLRFQVKPLHVVGGKSEAHSIISPQSSYMNRSCLCLLKCHLPFFSLSPV